MGCEKQIAATQITSKLLIMGAVKTTTNEQEYQHVTGRFESIRIFLSKQTGWPTLVSRTRISACDGEV